MPYPYYSEPAHDTGSGFPDSTAGVRNTAISAAEGRMVVDMKDSIFILSSL